MNYIAEETAIKINGSQSAKFIEDEPMLQTVTGYLISAIPPTLVDVVWSECIPYIQAVVDVSHDEITLNSVKSRCLKGDSLLLVTSKNGEIIGATLLEIRTFDSGVKAMYIPVVGGTEADMWMDQFFDVVKAIAKDFGCRELRGLAARSGWVRKLRSRGWEEVSIAMRCMLEE
jgi:hypothetical protein